MGLFPVTILEDRGGSVAPHVALHHGKPALDMGTLRRIYRQSVPILETSSLEKMFFIMSYNMVQSVVTCTL